VPWLAAGLGVLLVAAGGLHVAAQHWCGATERSLPGASCTAERAMHRTGHSADAEQSSEQADGPWSKYETGREGASDVPEQTDVRRRGTIAVVDVGVAESALADALRTQQQLARDRGQTVVVMLTGRRCRPCRGVDEALSDPAMQVALDGVRLLRVDIEVFREEIDELGMPRDVYPSFFLLGPDLSPRDAIHGGEWGADVADNIAPVIGAFVRGTYATRRYQWAPTSRSQRL
jgi:hypothetical protein